MPTKTHARHAKDDYLELVQKFPLTSIHNEEHLEQAFAVIDALAVIPEAKLSTGQADYLGALAILVEDYEDKHHAIDTSHLTPLDMLKFLMDQNDMSPSDVGRLLGDRSLGSKVLRGERGLSQRHIAILAERFHVSPSLFLKHKP